MVRRSPSSRIDSLMAKRSAGLMLYRVRDGSLEVLLVHPGGPLWARRDHGAWSIPKGEHAEADDPLTIAWREFEEDTGSSPPPTARPSRSTPSFRRAARS